MMPVTNYTDFETHLQRAILVAILVRSWPDFTWIAALILASVYAFYRCRFVIK
jgi:hypothetical protein